MILSFLSTIFIPCSSVGFADCLAVFLLLMCLKKFIIGFYASYDLFLKLSWPAFLFFTFNLLEFLFFPIFFIWHNFIFLNFTLKELTKWGLIALSGTGYELC